MNSINKINHAFDGFGSLLGEGKYPFLMVPDYQRGFDWSSKHVEELWEDLHYHVDKYMNDEFEDFYCGAIILKSPTSDETRYQIVDGQQRLTSFNLLAIVLREKFKDIDTDIKRDIDTTFINDYDDDYNRRPKFLGTKKIREVLKFISNNDWDGKFPEKDDVGFTDGRKLAPINKKLQDCMKSHRDELDGKGQKSEPYSDKQLKALVRVIKRLKLVVLEVPTDEKAFYLFETTNARGKELGPGDLLKNHLFSKSDENKRDLLYERWDNVVELSSGKLILMLKHFYYVHGSHVQKKDLYRNLKKLNENADELLSDIEDYAKFHDLMHNGTLDSFIDYFHEIGVFSSVQNRETYKTIYLPIRALRFFRSELTYPLIYAFLQKFCYLLNNDEKLQVENNRNSFKKILTQFLGALENFQFVNYKICSNKGNIIEIPYARFAGEIFKSKDVADFLNKLEKLYKFLRDNFNGPKEFVEKFSQLSYRNEDKKLFHYLFHKIEMNRMRREHKKNKVHHLKDPIFPWVKGIKYDIDHWIPQNFPKNEYSNYFEILDEIDTYPSDANLRDNIGNLSIMHRPLNNKLSNKIPKHKLDIIDNERTANEIIIQRYLNDFNVVVIINEGESEFNLKDIVTIDMANEENKRLESENKIQCIFEEYLWDVHCIVKRANDLANECYDEIFAIGDGVNFPLISKQMFEKFK